MQGLAASSVPLVVLGDSARPCRASPGALPEAAAEEFWTGLLQGATVRDVLTRSGVSRQPVAWQPFQQSLRPVAMGPGARLVGIPRVSPLGDAPSWSCAVPNTPAPFALPFIRRTTIQCGSTVVTVEESAPVRPAPLPIARGPAPGGREAVPAPKPLPHAPTSRAFERSQATSARIYWKEHLGDMPRALNGKWEGLTREFGLPRFRMAMDQVQRIGEGRSPSGKFKLLKRIFSGWRHAEGREQDWSRHGPEPEPEDSD